ncbi:MAG: NAD(P)H-dependent glycerol-3-phosphate dehydrogenase [Deltaproteobacteria bacterium]
MDNITVIGAGSWGTTLAVLLAEKDDKNKVRLWVREPELCAIMRQERENRLFLPGVKLPDNLIASDSLEDALSGGAAIIVCVVPSFAIRAVFSEARAFIKGAPVIVSATKGIEEDSLLLSSEVLSQALKGIGCEGMAILSGPSFAKEVSRRLPAAVSAAAATESVAKKVQEAFSTPHFRVYTNADATGVELGGALKNVIAIASGISDGLGLGCNARAALITRGLAEISRLGVKMGANPLTFSGLSGLGDLVLTCTAGQSRNYSLGYGMGKGAVLSELLSVMKEVAEGVKTARAAHALSIRHSVSMPITDAVYDALYAGKSPKQAVLELMTRDLRAE